MNNRSDTLPFDAVIFDLDGVITQTAMVHQKAWKQVFNQFMVEYSREHQVPNPPFEEDDYLRYVDGKPRYDGVQSFLLSRGIHLPMGSPDDSP